LDPSRRVFVGNPGGRFQAHAWDASTGEWWPVTDSEAAVTSADISHDGQWIYSMVEEEPGTEIGHFHRFPFSGGDSEDVTPDLDPYAAYLIELTKDGIVMLGGLGGGPVMILADAGESRVVNLPSLPIGLVALEEGRRAAITLSTPGRGLIPMLRVYDLVSGEVIAEMDEMAATAAYGDLMAVAVVDGDWMRPADWDGDALTPIETDVPGDLVPADWSSDGSTILLSQTYRAGGAFYLYRVATGEVVELASPPGSPFSAEARLLDSETALSIWSDANHPRRPVESRVDGWRVALSLDGQGPYPGPQWEEFIYPSTGGAEIQGWLLRPEGKGPWPTVLDTHGGPSSGHTPTFNPICAAWFDRGFAVASVNYRGSTTFGESFREALTGRIGGPDIEDVAWAWRWLVDNRIADPDRVVKNGYSYGGFLTLQALGTHPDLWVAGVAGAPIADWALGYEDTNDVLRSYDLSLFGGSPDEMPEAYAKASPRTYAANYRAPILISQPKNDTRTPIGPVKMFADDLRAHGKQVELELLSGGHAGVGVDQTIQMVESWLDFGSRIVGLD
jgi:dienelactone hydrolase